MNSISFTAAANNNNTTSGIETPTKSTPTKSNRIEPLSPKPTERPAPKSNVSASASNNSITTSTTNNNNNNNESKSSVAEIDSTPSTPATATAAASESFNAKSKFYLSSSQSSSSNNNNVINQNDDLFDSFNKIINDKNDDADDVFCNLTINDDEAAFRFDDNFLDSSFNDDSTKIKINRSRKKEFTAHSNTFSSLESAFKLNDDENEDGGIIETLEMKNEMGDDDFNGMFSSTSTPTAPVALHETYSSSSLQSMTPLNNSSRLLRSLQMKQGS